jgi:hypothetical protein
MKSEGGAGSVANIEYEHFEQAPIKAITLKP